MLQVHEIAAPSFLTLSYMFANPPASFRSMYHIGPYTLHSRQSVGGYDGMRNN